MKIKNLKKSVGDFQRANAGGHYDPGYGYLMFDRSTGELWTDCFYSLGHNEWKQYHDPAIINLISWACNHGYDGGPVNMANVRKWAEEAAAEYKS